MIQFEKEVLKYLLLIIAFGFGLFMVGLISPFLIQDYGDLAQADEIKDKLFLIITISRVAFGIIFGLILYFDCRREIENKYSIPVLGALTPIVGVMFYFIEKYSKIKRSINEI